MHIESTTSKRGAFSEPPEDPGNPHVETNGRKLTHTSQADKATVSPVGQTQPGSDCRTTALIVEDDDAIVDLLEERLLSMGHMCRKAQSQAEAEEILNDHVFDYILLDLEIPSRSQGRPNIVYGQNLLRKIRRTPGHRRTPVLVITGHGLECHRLCAETMKLGATDFIGKPFGRDNPLEDKIREALGSHSTETNRGVKTAPAKLAKFTGGDLIFYDDRVDLCGIKVCGARNDSIKRRLLEILRERTGKGEYRCFPMKDIAGLLKLDRVMPQGGVDARNGDFEAFGVLAIAE